LRSSGEGIFLKFLKILAQSRICYSFRNSMNTSMPDISVVILCYKSKEIVLPFVAEMKRDLEKRGISYELVLVANYNAHEEGKDSTPGIVENLAKNDPTITPVIKVKEGMMGWDMRSGLDVASGKTIAVIDGDGQMPVEDVIKVYDALVSGNYDFAKTYRTTRLDGLKRRIISKSYNFLLKLLFPKVRVKDANSKPKIFTREALKKIKLTSNDWFIDAEIMIEASRLSLRIIEVPTVFRENMHRRSFVKNSTVFEFLKNLIKYRLFKKHE
jgi:glycosyltransferase involved in cell wall biosynthesis